MGSLKQKTGLASAGWFKKKEEQEVLDSVPKLSLFIDSNRDRVDVVAQLKEVGSLLKQKQEAFTPNTKEIVSEFEGQLKNVMGMVTGCPSTLSSTRQSSLQPEEESPP